MWQVYALLAHDILHDRRREAEREALNRLFRDGAAAGSLPNGRGPVGPGFARRAVAGALRRLGSTAGTLADHACTAAARLEGRPA